MLNSSRRPSDEQLKMLVDYMESHTLFARKQITKLGECGVDKYRSMLSTLTGLLNAAGPAQKIEEQWEKFWDDQRLRAQDAMKHFLYWSRQTGHHNVAPLSDIDLQICRLFGHYGAGTSLLPEVGVYCVQINIPNDDDDSWSEENSFYSAYDKYSSDGIDEQKSEYIMDLQDMQASTSGTSRVEKVKEKLSVEEIVYIASSVDQQGGDPPLLAWNQIAEKPLLKHLKKSGEWLNFWEIKVTEVLNKQIKISSSVTGKTKLTRAEGAILRVVQGNVEQSTSTFLGSATKSSQSTDTAAMDNTDYPPLKRPAEIDREPAVATKKSKLTSLQVQKNGLKAIVDGNETLAFLTDLLTEGLRNNELASMALTQAINNLKKGVTDAINDGYSNVCNDVRLLGDRVCSTMFNIHTLRTKGYISPKKRAKPHHDLEDLTYEDIEDFHRVPQQDDEDD